MERSIRLKNTTHAMPKMNFAVKNLHRSDRDRTPDVHPSRAFCPIVTSLENAPSCPEDLAAVSRFLHPALRPVLLHKSSNQRGKRPAADKNPLNFISTPTASEVFECLTLASAWFHEQIKAPCFFAHRVHRRRWRRPDAGHQGGRPPVVHGHPAVHRTTWNCSSPPKL